MSKEQHHLVVGKDAMRQMYEHFEQNLFSTYSCILGKLFSRGVLGKRLMHQIRCSDPDRALHMLLDHLCEQDTGNLRVLVKVLDESGREECLPGHTHLAEKLESHLNDPVKDSAVTLKNPILDRNDGLHDLVNPGSNLYPISLPTPVQATTEESSTIAIVCGKELESTQVLWEYPQLMSSLLYFFDDKLERDEVSTATCGDVMTPTQSKCVRPSLEMPLIKFAGPLKGRTHGDLVILLWRLGGSDPTNCNLAYQLIQGKKQQLPIDLQIINVLGAVYATSDNAHLFQEALEWTKRPDCMNPVYLQCRLNYLLSICTITSDRDLSQQYLKQAQELSVMCEPDFTTALLAMQEARTIFFGVEDHPSHLDEQTMMQIIRLSHRACEISCALPNWMQPFAVVVTLLKMQLDARIALLLVKSGNHIGAIAAVSCLAHLIQQLEDPATFRQLIPRQRATYHYIKAVVSFINKDRDKALHHATLGHSPYLKVNSIGPAHRVMELINYFK